MSASVSAGGSNGTSSAPRSTSRSSADRQVAATDGVDVVPEPARGGADPHAGEVLAGRRPGSRAPARRASRGRAGRGPASRRSSRLTSRIRRAIGPAVSSERDSGSAPYVETRPCAGRRLLRPQAAAGMRSEPPVSEPVATGTMRAASAAPGAAGRAAGRPREVPRVARRVRAGAVRELVQRRLAEQARAGVAQPLPDRGVDPGVVALEHPARGRRRHARGQVEVLQRDRHAGERAGRAGRRPGRRRPARRPRGQLGRERPRTP